MPDYDLVVVGAGPAGSSAALSALHSTPDARVLLLDRVEFPRDKACGDGVAPHVLDVLDSVGAGDLLCDLPPLQNLEIGVADGPSTRRAMARAVHVVRRTELDARLVRAAVEHGAEFTVHRVRRIDLRATSVVLDDAIRARTVVAADGAYSTVRRALGLRRNATGTTAIAIRGYAPVPDERADAQVIAFGSLGRLGGLRGLGYAWSFPLGDGWANVGYGEVPPAARSVGRTELLARLDALLPGAGANGQKWRAHHLPLSTGRPSHPSGRVLLAGDALSLVNPLTGEGIYYAVLSGVLAGRVALTADDPGAAYRAALGSSLQRHLRHTRAASALAGSPRLRRAGVCAARRDQRVFDALVELGLNRGLLAPRTLLRVACEAARSI